jgi:hypothetical protein
MVGKAAAALAVKNFVEHQLKQDLPKQARRVQKQLARLDWERDFLNRAGLMRTSSAPGFGTGLALFVLGGLAGGLAALLLAPKTGPEFRSEVRTRAQGLMPAQKQGMATQGQAHA